MLFFSQVTTSISASFCGTNQVTEDCSDRVRPVWDTVVCFSLPSQGKGKDRCHSVKGTEMHGFNQDSKKRNKYDTNHIVADESDVSNENVNYHSPPSAHAHTYRSTEQVNIFLFLYNSTNLHHIYIYIYTYVLTD